MSNSMLLILFLIVAAWKHKHKPTMQAAKNPLEQQATREASIQTR
jgi:hypothetical protein